MISYYKMLFIVIYMQLGCQKSSLLLLMLYIHAIFSIIRTALLIAYERWQWIQASNIDSAGIALE